VGKESVVEGLATRMVEESVPPVLSDKRLMVLTAARLLAGATPAVAQERLLHVLSEVHRAGNIILFIPNIENIIGVSEGESGSLDVAGVLARELQSGSFLMFATTTPEAYRRYVQNTSISSAFSRVDVPEMSVDQAIRVLEAKAGYIEYEHGIWFSYAAIETAAQFSARYIHEGKLPDKAIVVIKEAAEAVKGARGKDALVSAQDVAKIISEKSKIPVTAVTEDESQKLLRLETTLHERVIGQEEAVREVASALRRSRAQLTGGKRTIANFLFLGPTGVGKTELSKTVAEVYFGGEKQMIRLDMSEFQDTTSALRLIGQPGVKGSGVLTEAIKEKPFALLLLDELEKAHPNVLNLFLQVMDDGRITDSTGVTIDCTNIILIATSNAGTQYVQDEMGRGTSFPVIQEALLRGKLSEWYRPEFLNRFDAMVLFRPLAQNEIGRIAELMVHTIANRLEDQGIGLRIDAEILTYLAQMGFDPQFGARPLRRVIQDRVENTIAELLLAKKVHRGDTIHFTHDGVRIEQST
jgi:ATP-dependent Clp protease ATP-binding subunit ClpC